MESPCSLGVPPKDETLSMRPTVALKTQRDLLVPFLTSGPLLVMKLQPSEDTILTDPSMQHGSRSPNQNTMPEDALDYVSRPEGEMDMMIGFFLMNGICVAFFLLFGLCVIFSCLRQRPKIFRKQRVQRRLEVPLAPPAPVRFKTFVSRAIKTGAIETLKTNDVEHNILLDKNEVKPQPDGAQIQIHVSSSPDEKKKQKRSNSTTQILSEAEVYAKDSVIRQNLLGPLSFDDLYYT